MSATHSVVAFEAVGIQVLSTLYIIEKMPCPLAGFLRRMCWDTVVFTKLWMKKKISFIIKTVQSWTLKSVIFTNDLINLPYEEGYVRNSVT